MGQPGPTAVPRRFCTWRWSFVAGEGESGVAGRPVVWRQQHLRHSPGTAVLVVVGLGIIFLQFWLLAACKSSGRCS